MNCTDFRNNLIAAAGESSDAMRSHAGECAACRDFAQDMTALDRAMRDALAVDVPDNLGQTRLLQKIAQRRRRALGVYAAAASVLVAVGLVAGLLIGKKPSPMPSALIAHVLHEASLLEPSATVVPIERVSNLLGESNVLLNGDIGTVRHAGLCPFRGNMVPHLIVNTPTGPVTVMLLPDESVKAPERFDEEGLRGVVVPAGRGSIAVIGDEPDEVDAVRKRFSRAVEYSI